MTDIVTAPWAPVEEPIPLGHPRGVIMQVEGSSFAVATPRGAMRAHSAHGLFFRDTRFVSELRLTVDGVEPEPLEIIQAQPFAATFLQRTPPRRGHADTSLLLVRRRYVGRGLREDVELRHHGLEPVTCEVRLDLACDFADLFTVKDGAPAPAPEQHRHVGPGTIVCEAVREGVGRATHISCEPPPTEPGELVWTVTLAPQESWTMCLEITLVFNSDPVAPRFRCGEPVESALPPHRLSGWREATTTVGSDHADLTAAAAHAVEDLGVLRIEDPDDPDLPIVAAGAPWFMTLFGRDSLLTSWMALLASPDLARGSLTMLARLQGDRHDPTRDEEPGKIVHELRFGGATTPRLADAERYYGTVDATPLFVMLAGELHRWGLLDDGQRAALRPHLARAMAWLRGPGDPDGDGYLEYARRSDAGLHHQGWKDSWDAIRYADGRHAEPPIALCEVQGYAYAAELAWARLAAADGDAATAEAARRRAAALADRFHRDFWLADRGWYALALDADKQPVDALTSNVGHLLWTGICPPEAAAVLAEHLASPALASGFGVRTMAASMTAYNPVSYHCGSVWPHDTAIAVAGLAAYGHTDVAGRLALDLLDLVHAGGRLPELVCGFDRDEFGEPVGYPTSCSPQAWAAASPLLLLRALLRLEPDADARTLHLAPALPDPVGRVRLQQLRLGGATVDVTVEGEAVTVDGLPPGWRVTTAPRPRESPIG